MRVDDAQIGVLVCILVCTKLCHQKLWNTDTFEITRVCVSDTCVSDTDAYITLNYVIFLKKFNCIDVVSGIRVHIRASYSKPIAEFNTNFSHIMFNDFFEIQSRYKQSFVKENNLVRIWVRIHPNVLKNNLVNIWVRIHPNMSLIEIYYKKKWLTLRFSCVKHFTLLEKSILEG